MRIYFNFMDRVTMLTKYTLVLVVSIMSILVFGQVIGRYVLESTPPFLPEIATYCLVWTAFLGSSLAFTKNKHVSLSLFVDKLTGKTSNFVTLISNLCVLLFLLIFLMASITFSISSWEQTSATLDFRMTWPALGPPIGTVLMILQVLRNIFESRRG